MMSEYEKDAEEFDEGWDDPCPECGADIISLWSGIKCSECSYWFCY